MKTLAWLASGFMVTVLLLSGCAGGSTEQSKAGGAAVSPPTMTGTPTDSKAAIRTSLEKLSSADRKLAEEQGFCAVENKNLLGSMGVPVKVMVKDQPVFLCCDACETRAKAHADRTLARVQQLKEQRAGTPDR